MPVQPILESELNEAREILSDLISIPSPSGSEGLIIDHLEGWAADEGFSSRRVPAENGRESLVLGACRNPVLAIVAHVDTVTALWADPTVPRNEGNIVHGLGAVDDKGGVAACMLAARLFRSAGGNLDDSRVVFAFSVDEETGGAGSRSLAIDLTPRFMIALEGTELRPGTVECGDIDALVHVHGRSAHGSLTDLGDNAVHAAAAFIAGLPSLGLSAFDHPVLGESGAHVNEIRSGEGMNVIPDSCTMSLGIRLVPGQDLFGTIRQVEDYARQFNATLQMVEGTEPFELPADSPLLERIAACVADVAGAPPDPVGVPAWTDAHNFVDFGGSEAMIFGPGSFETAHTPEEQIDLTQIVECSRIFARLIDRENIDSMALAPPRDDIARYRKSSL